MKYPEIAKRFEIIMNLRGLKQVDLVNKTGISKASINQYVKGTHCPTNDRAFLLSKVLRVNPAWLMGFDVPMDNVPVENKGELTDKEKHFIDLYQQLNPEERHLIDGMITTLASKK